MSTTSALMIEWGMPKDGRETKALEEFMTHVAWWNELKTKGKVADFRTYGPVTGNFERAGFVILEGTEAQIDQLRTSEDFRTRLNHVMLVGNHINVTLCETGDAMMSRMQRYGKSLKDKHIS
jgi:hypothetical protein